MSKKITKLTDLPAITQLIFMEAFNNFRLTDEFAPCCYVVKDDDKLYKDISVELKTQDGVIGHISNVVDLINLGADTVIHVDHGWGVKEYTGEDLSKRGSLKDHPDRQRILKFTYCKKEYDYIIVGTINEDGLPEWDFYEEPIPENLKDSEWQAAMFAKAAELNLNT